MCGSLFTSMGVVPYTPLRDSYSFGDPFLLTQQICELTLKGLSRKEFYVYLNKVPI